MNTNTSPYGEFAARLRSVVEQIALPPNVRAQVVEPWPDGDVNEEDWPLPQIMVRVMWTDIREDDSYLSQGYATIVIDSNADELADFTFAALVDSKVRQAILVAEEQQ